jgi:hypothetical protein
MTRAATIELGETTTRLRETSSTLRLTEPNER